MLQLLYSILVEVAKKFYNHKGIDQFFSKAPSTLLYKSHLSESILLDKEIL